MTAADVRQQAIEVAAKALYETQPFLLVDEAEGVITGPKPWEWCGEEYQESVRAKVRLVLDAAGVIRETDNTRPRNFVTDQAREAERKHFEDYTAELADSEYLGEALFTISDLYHANVTNNEPRWQDGKYLRQVGDFITEIEVAICKHGFPPKSEYLAKVLAERGIPEPDEWDASAVARSSGVADTRWDEFCDAIGYKIPETGELADVPYVVKQVKQWAEDSSDLYELQNPPDGVADTVKEGNNDE